MEPNATAPLPVRESAQTRVLRILREWITGGHYRAGQSLPTEDEMARQVGVSRGTLRLAVRRLKSEGLIQTQRGRPHLVTSAARSDTLMSDTLVLLCRAEVAPGLHKGISEAVESGAYDAAKDLHRSVLTLPVGALQGTTAKLLSERPQGVIFSEIAAEYGPSPAECDRLLSAGIPVVVNSDEPRWARFDRIVSDHRQGAYDLTRWLLNRGRRRILRFWIGEHEDEYWFRARNSGYEDAMREAGLPLLPSVTLPERPADAHADVVRLCAGFLVEALRDPAPVDALMLVSDVHAPLAAAACRLFGKEPNRDVDIVGYDNRWSDMGDDLRQICPSFRGPVATVDKCDYEVGQELTRLLLKRVAGELPPDRQRLLCKPELIPLEA